MSSFRSSFNPPPALVALIGGVLLWAAWPVRGVAPLLFLGLVPLLWLEHQSAGADPITHRRPAFFRWAYLLLLTWNALTTWWVSNATIWGGIVAVILNALLLLLPLLAFRRTKRALGPGWGYASFIIYWVAFEHLHLSWDLTWPWLTLGNGFAAWPAWVQWYEYTGHLGGSVWILAVNVFAFRVALPFLSPSISIDQRVIRHAQRALLASIALPLLWSGWLLWRFEERGPAAEVVVVQPNIDPYEEKFPSSARFVTYEEQVARLLRLSEGAVTPHTRVVFWPETALEKGVDEADLEQDWRVQRIRRFLRHHPGLRLVTGITTFVTYPDRAHASPTVRESAGVFYDVFNTALLVPGPTGPLTTYHKSKLVPGVEKLPYPQVFSLLKPLAIDLGGTVGSYGSQPMRSVFSGADPADPVVAPVICYESIYADFVADYVRQGQATLIGIITNDGWWGDTPGYRQHLRYAGLRAIETRRDVVRSANTGTSAFLDQRGRVTQSLVWWREGALRGTVHLNPELTFYVRYGDLLALLLPWATAALLLLTIIRSRRLPRQHVLTHPDYEQVAATRSQATTPATISKPLDLPQSGVG